MATEADYRRAIAALRNLVGYFGGADTRLRLGKAYTDDHAAILREARDVIEFHDTRAVRICPCGHAIEDHNDLGKCCAVIGGQQVGSDSPVTYCPCKVLQKDAAC